MKNEEFRSRVIFRISEILKSHQLQNLQHASQVRQLNLEISSPPFERIRRGLADVHQKIAPKHYRLKFGGGEFCPGSGRQREAEIWFQCPNNFQVDQSKSLDLVMALEPQTCSYRLIVNSLAACLDPQLRWQPRTLEDDRIKCKKL